MRAIYKSLCIFNILIFIINTALYIALAMDINRLYGTPGRYLSSYVVFYIVAVLKDKIDDETWLRESRRAAHILAEEQFDREDLAGEVCSVLFHTKIENDFNGIIE